MCYRKEFDFNVLFIHLRTKKVSFNALVSTLRSNVELNRTRAIRLVIAKSLRFSKIAKKLNVDLCHFILIEGKHCSYENHEIKNGVSVLVFAVVPPNAFSPIFETGLGLANHLSSQTPDLKPPSQAQGKTPVISLDSSIKQRLQLSHSFQSAFRIKPLRTKS